MRRLQEELSFVDEAAAKKMYIDEVMEFYRESLQEAEATIYPDVRQKYFKRAQDNIVKMQKNERTFMKTCRKLNAEMEKMRMEPYDLKANKPIHLDTVDTPVGVLESDDDASEKDLDTPKSVAESKDVSEATPKGAAESKDGTPKGAGKSWIKKPKAP